MTRGVPGSAQVAGAPTGDAAPSGAAGGRAAGLAMAASIAVVVVHTWLVWGYPSIWWGDNGRWLHELDRVAHGATFYRDIYWAFPPLAMWVMGGLARVVGSDLAQVWSMTAALALVLAVAYGAVVARLVPGRRAVTIAAAGMLLGVAYSQQNSAPLSLGMYSPAVPVAFTCLVLQLLLFLRDWERPSLVGALAVGAVGGLGILAKHDVWMACGWLTLAAGAITPRGAESRFARLVAAGGALIAVAGAGLGVLAAQHGTATLRDILTGFGHVEEFAGVNLPDLSMLTVELSTLGLAIVIGACCAALGGALSARRAVVVAVAGSALALVAMGIWLWQAEVTMRGILAHGVSALPTPFENALRPVEPTSVERLRKALGVLRLQMLRHLVPVFVPLLLLTAVVVARARIADRRRWWLVVVLLVACLALRSRRMISYVEWSALMLELPVAVAAASLVWPTLTRAGVRAVPLATAALAAFGLQAHWRLGYGWGTRRGATPAVATARGPAHLVRGLATDLAYIRDVAKLADPSGTRPLFAFGYSGGLSYFVGRPSIDPLTQGLRLSLLPTADSAYRLVAAQKSRLLLVDNRSYVDGVPSPAFAPWRWQPEMLPNPYQRVDRAYFERLREGCRALTLPGRRSAIFTVYDCAAAPASDESTP